MIIKTLQNILNNPWSEIVQQETWPTRTPMKWLEARDMEINDVDLWEEIFYQSGAIGVYASWQPYEEFYIIVHNLHLHRNFFEIFVGPTAADLVVERCKLFGITLSYKEAKSFTQILI